jgi:DNA-binding NarL/FixJ family response regulator
MNSQKKIMIVEDDLIIAQHLKKVFKSDLRFEVVGLVTHANNIVAEVQKCAPDLILLDIIMPMVNGVEATKRIRAAGITTPILIQTAHDNDDYVFESLRQGANGYVLKDTSPERLISYALEALEGGAPLSPSVSKKILQQAFSQKTVSDALEAEMTEDQKKLLTEREKHILSCLAEGKMYKTIADELNCQIDAVRFHVKNIYKKLHIHSRQEIIQPNKWWVKLLRRPA